MSKGIYKFTNRINNKSYIGQSFDLKHRHDEHLYRYNRQTTNNYNCKFYRALRKYGIESFEYTILCEDDNYTRDELNQLEKYYIEKYDSFYNGYNETLGGDYSNAHTKLNEEEVLKIIDLLQNSKESLVDIARQFDVSGGTIALINNGEIWTYLYNDEYPIRKEKVRSALGSRNGRAKLTEEDVINIRNRYVNEKLEDIYKNYSDIVSIYTFKKVIYGTTFNHLPYYRKYKKEWVFPKK